MREATPQAEDIPLDIMFEDDHIIVINKPSGMVVHPGPGQPDGTLVNALIAHCGDSLTGIGGVMRPGICLLYTSPSPRDRQKSRMPSSA